MLDQLRFVQEHFFTFQAHKSLTIVHVHVGLKLFYSIKTLTTVRAIEPKFASVFRRVEFQSHVGAEGFTTVLAYIARPLMHRFDMLMQFRHSVKSMSAQPISAFETSY